MKKTQIVATLAFAFMLGIAMPITQLFNSNSAYATEQADTTEEAIPVSDETELKTNVKAGHNVQLTGNITITGTISLVGTTATIDLNGHNIDSTFDGDIFAVWGAGLTITGTGTISSSGATPYGIIAIYDGTAYGTGTNHVTIDSNVTINATGNKYAITVFKQTQTEGNYRSTLDFNGKITGNYGITINGAIQDFSKAPIMNINSNSSINTTNLAIYAAGVGEWSIGAASITSGTTIAAKAGSFEINGATISANAVTDSDPELSGNGINTNGAVFQIEHNTSYADNIVLNINGGTYKSAQANVFYEYDENTNARAVTKAADINITAGTFAAGTGKAIFGGFGSNQVDVQISGGTFSGTDVAEFKENGYLVGNLTVNANGAVVSPTSSRPSTSTPAEDDPTTPADPETPAEDPSDDNPNDVPDTGILDGHGIISAISTITPILMAGGFAFMFFSGKIHERERQRRLAAIESEIDAEVEDLIDEPEPVMDHFVAVPISRDEPTITPVDSFVSHK